MKNKKADDWYPFYIDKYLFGSTRLELAPDERSVWVDLLTLSKKDDGFIRANEGVPYLKTQLCGMLVISEELFDRTIEKCLKYGKLKNLPDGSFFVISTEKYQLSDRHKRRVFPDLCINDSESISAKCPAEFSDMATKNGFVRRSRLMVAQIIGRSLTSEEEVHHINGKSTDDRLENLMLFANHKDHTQYEWGKKVDPIWDGSAMAEKTAIRAEKGALEENREDKNRIDKNKNTPNLDSEFSDFWEAYPIKEGKADALKAFRVLRKTTPLETIAQAFNGYMDFLKHERVKNNFERRPKLAATFLRSDRWKEFIDFKYKAPL